MSWKGPKCPVCSGRMVQAWVDAGHTRHGSCGPEPSTVDAPPPPNGSSPSPTPTPPPDRALADPLPPPGEDSGPPPPGNPTRGRRKGSARPPGSDTLTARQREILAAVKRELEVGGSLQGAATTLGVTGSAVSQALYRMGENGLLRRLSRQDAPPSGAAHAPPRVPSRGGAMKTTETDEGLRAWRESRSKVQHRPAGARLPPSLQFGLDLVNGRIVRDDELSTLVQSEREQAAKERSKILGARKGEGSE
jgi:hypothetical protein